MLGPVIAAPEASYLARLRSIRISNKEFSNVPVCFNSIFSCIGKDFLHAFRMTFDCQRNEILLSPVEGMQVEDNFETYGIRTSFDQQNHLIEKGFWENSSADRAGINPGDEIIKICGRNASELSDSDIIALRRDERRRELELEIRGKTVNGPVTIKKENIFPE